MNKSLIVFLAICLISVHAFVKRDAPAPQNNYLDDFNKQFQDVTSKIQDGIKSSLDPNEIKKSYEQFVGSVSKMFDGNGKKA